MRGAESPAVPSSKELLDVVTHFGVVFKLAKVFEPNNINFRERLDLLFAGFQRILADSAELGIQARSGFLFVNWNRLKFDVSAYPIFRVLMDAFLDRKIGAVFFFQGLTREELAQFMIFLARVEVPREFPFETLDLQFRKSAFAHIGWDKVSEEEEGELADKSPAPIFFLGIYHLQQLFRIREGSWNLALTRRWIQSVCDLMVLDESFLLGLINLKNFEDDILNHSVNVCILSLALGRRIGLTRPELVDLGVGAALHDVGKLEVPREILDKPDVLDSRERAIVERHTQSGANVLIKLMMLHELPIPAVQVALEHHVMADLNGYPKYVRRTHLSIYSRIVKITDYYDALTTKRVYRPVSFTPESAVAFMKQRSGREFEPLLFRAFERMIGIYPVGSLVALSSGQIGIVFENNLQESLGRKPKVKIIAEAAGRRIDGPLIDLAETGARPGIRPLAIVKSLDPDKYGIRIPDYFLARSKIGRAESF